MEFGGFKSYDDDPHELRFGNVTVLLGANGAGKSNLISQNLKAKCSHFAEWLEKLEGVSNG